MAMSISVNLRKIKNMGKALFFGLPYPNKNKSNSTMEIGGVVYQMVMASTANKKVKHILNSGDFYIGKFKNGLKHGKGT
jgi:hypothetical protein